MKLRRGMIVRLGDGSIHLVRHVFRFPANTKYRKKGPVMFNSSEWLWHDVYDSDVEILGFAKGLTKPPTIKRKKNYDKR